MADEQDRSFTTGTSQANRASNQGLGVGQREMDAQRDPNRAQVATNPEQRSFDGDLDGATNADRPAEADFGEEEASAQPDAERGDTPGVPEGDLGAGTPANVDIHNLGQQDNPQEDWGEAAGEGAVHSSNNTRRGEKTEAERGQGAKTRAHNKDTFSRRS